MVRDGMPEPVQW